MSVAGGNMALRHDIEILPAAVLAALFAPHLVRWYPGLGG